MLRWLVKVTGCLWDGGEQDPTGKEITGYIVKE